MRITVDEFIDCRLAQKVLLGPLDYPSLLHQFCQRFETLDQNLDQLFAYFQRNFFEVVQDGVERIKDFVGQNAKAIIATLTPTAQLIDHP